MAARTICSDIAMSVSTVFCPLLNVYINDMQIDRWLYLSTSPWGIPFCCDFFRKKNRPEKSPLMSTTD